ncbi:MAG: hypothetical protein LBM95_06445 [Lactobacillales bacterium]|jgi:hypothetical protein|nr:hypothetical protein [Lactobacillales bacterium]
MEQAFIDLVVYRVIEKFQMEEEFYGKQLGLTEEDWEKWKRGHLLLSDEAIQQIVLLFSDYEWMLVQKVILQTKIIPEKLYTAVADYQKMSATIAKKWLTTDIATIEIVEKLQEENKLDKMIEVRIIMSYDSWGYSDILTFFFPAVDRNKVAGSRRELIQFMTEIYTEKE